jgi:hypothetical protein
VTSPGRFLLEIPMSFYRQFRAALFFGVPRWVVARAIGYHKVAPVAANNEIEVIGSRVAG